MREVLDYNVVPNHYKIKVTVLEDSFEGEECVDVEVKKTCTGFSFNSKDLQLSNLKIINHGNELKFSVIHHKETVEIAFEEEINEGEKLQLFVDFTGKYSKDMWGFYKSKYNEDDLYSTDFEPTNARRAFPCWDQPDLKATFEIAVKPLEGHIALSNSDLREIKDGVYYFNTTPKMSTYIVAYIAGKLECITKNTQRNIPVSVYAHKDETSWGEYAVDVAVECLDFFEEYFGIEYPLPKLDLVSIPTFVSGAMENWGLVTFRKTSLLYKQDSSSVRSKKRIAETVCHELAHMWFGNLVTMKWWNDLWLNEGFATWAASLAMDNISKKLIDWDVWTEFINSDIESGMSHDCLESSHPIAVEVNSPSEISQIFDNISYSKGASMIRMLEGYIGAKVFRDGLRGYLKRYAYSNTTTEDLWNSFPPELKVSEIMNDWINKQGFPILYVKDTQEDVNYTSSVFEPEESCVREQSEYIISIEQSIFQLSGKTSNDLWKIPLTIRWYDDKQQTDTFLMTSRKVELNKVHSVYKLNVGATGFYRVKYTTENLAHLLESDIPTEDRLNLINDMFALINARKAKAIDGIVLCELFADEANPEILCSILYSLAKIRSIFYDNDSVIQHINGIILDIVGERARKINLCNKNVTTEQVATNEILISYALSCNDKSVVKKLNEAYNLYRKKQYVCPEYMRSVFAAVADSQYKNLLEIYKTCTSPEESVMALSALSMIQDTTLLKQILERYSEFEPHNSIYFFLGLGANYRNRDTVLGYISDNFDAIREYTKNDRLFQYVVEGIFGLVSTDTTAYNAKKLLITKKDGELVMPINKTIEKIDLNLEFRRYNSNLVINK